MVKSTTIIAFDQHAATTVAAVLRPADRTPALHPLTSDVPTILRLAHLRLLTEDPAVRLGNQGLQVTPGRTDVLCPCCCATVRAISTG